MSLLRADLAPLRASRDFRLLSISRTVTLFGMLAAGAADMLSGIFRDARCGCYALSWPPGANRAK